jgi:peptidoglycan-N-acetylglucosamine deacetylase
MTGATRVASVVLAFFVFLTGCTAVGNGVEPERPEKKAAAKAPQPAKTGEAKQQKQAKVPARSTEQKPFLKKPESIYKGLTEKEIKVLKEFSGKHLIYSGPAFGKRVALTFDDGPDRHYTLQILDILKRERVPATFFVVGNLSRKYPDVLKRIDREGHVIGNHSYSHPLLTKMTMDEVDAQLYRTNEIIRKETGKTPLLFRPPYGAVNKRLEKHLAAEGFRIIQWSVDTRDWAGPSSRKIIHTVKSQVGPGGIILQHSAGGPQLKETVEALPVIIRYLKENGYEFVTVDRLLDVPAYAEYVK